MQTIQDTFSELVSHYAKALPAKLTDIKQSWESLKAQWDSQTLMALEIKIHNLSGSAGLYGYNKLGEIAKQFNLYLDKFDFDIQPDAAQIAELDLLIEELMVTARREKAHIQLADILLPNKLELSESLIYCFDKDANWLESIRPNIAAFSYELKFFNGVDKLLAALDEANPLALLVNFDLMQNSFDINLADPSTNDLIELFLKKFNTIFFSKYGDIDSRLAAVRMGGKAFLTQPFSTEELIRTLTIFKRERTEIYRVLIIDDEEALGAYYVTLLSDAKMQAKHIASIQDLDKQLHEFKPDVILSDLNMPQCSGMDLALVLRQQKAYEHLPIIFLSSENDKAKQLSALQTGADDFVTKNTDPTSLVQIIRNHACRYGKIRALTIKDNLTGAFTYLYITYQIANEIAQSTFASPLALCVIHLDQLESVIQRFGYSMQDQLMINLYLFLRNHLDFQYQIGCLDQERFIIIFPKTQIEVATDTMERLQEKYAELLFYNGNEAFQSTFSVGLTAYTGVESPEGLIQAARENLAKHAKL